MFSKHVRGAGFLLTTVVGLVAGSAAGSAFAQTSSANASSSVDEKSATESPDVLIFKNGNVLKGKILSETEKGIKFRSSVGGIEFETEYGLDQILTVTRGATVSADAKKQGSKKPDAKPDGSLDAKPDAARASTDDAEPKVDGTKYYWLTLDGEFGVDISESPIRTAMKDAREKKADVVIVELDARWARPGDGRSELKEDDAAFDQLFRAEKIIPIFVNEMPSEWDKMPRIVFWVKQAMGGAAFVPLISPDIYFSPEGRIGGIGNLSTMLQGNERVVQKQISLRLQHAVGWANVGGYPEELIRAMTRKEYVLSVKIVDGKPEYYERLPEGPDEELLTDSGEGEFEDSIDKLARAEGNDTLTLNARRAELVGVSDGTVETKQDLLAALGLDRAGVDVGQRAGRIMEDWRKGLEAGQRQIVRTLQEFREIEVQAPGDYAARSRARGARISKLESLKGLLKRWEEGLTAQWRGRNEVPPLDEIQSMIERIKTEQISDRRDE